MTLFTWILGLPVLFGLCYGRFTTVGMWLIFIAISAIFIICRTKGEKHNILSFGISADVYVRQSGIGAIRADWKLWGTLGILLLALFSNSFIAASYVAVSMAFLTVYSGVPWRKYLSLATLPLLFMLCSQLAILFLLSPKPLGYFDIAIGESYLALTVLSQQTAWLLLSKALCGMACLYFISLTTAIADIIGALKKARLPNLIIELMYLIYRYIFILLRVQSAMHIAADARLGFGNLKSQWRSFTGIASNLLVLAFRQASACFDAMEARGYDGRLEFLEGKKAIPDKKQAIFWFCYLLLFTGIILGKC